MGAVIYYDQAYKIYTQHKKWKKAISIQEKLIPINEKLNDTFQQARNYENIIKC